MRCRVVILLAVMLVGPYTALGQHGGIAPVESESFVEELPREPDEIVPVVHPSERMTTRVAFVVDTSGSMDNNRRVQMAITFAKNILGQGGDELLVALYSFKDSYERWPGVPHDEQGPPPPPGWTEFPGIPQLESAQAWLTARGASGGTSPAGAVTAALAEKIPDLTVVIITDGEFNGDSFKQAVANGQAAREKSELGRAVIIVIGVGDNAEGQQHLRDVGGSGGGGLYVVRQPRPPSDMFDEDD